MSTTTSTVQSPPVNGVSAYLDSNISVSSLPQETIDFARKVFNLARNGGDELLSAYLNAGLPPNLTNEKGKYLIFLLIIRAHSKQLLISPYFY